MKNILIVGCGYIGKQVAQRLSSRGIDVHATVQSQASAQSCAAQGINAYTLDLDQPTALPGHLRNAPLHLLYLVAPPHQGNRDSRLTVLLDMLNNQPIEKFILISTTGVYGDCQGHWIDENAPIQPHNARAKRRVDAEQQCQSFCQQSQLPLVILRVPGIYGPGKLPLARLRSAKPIVRKEDSPYSNRIHAEDLATICISALLSERITGVFNCTDGHPTTMYDYLVSVAAHAGIPLPATIPLSLAMQTLSPQMISYLTESRRIKNNKLLEAFAMQLRYPDLQSGLAAIKIDEQG